LFFRAKVQLESFEAVAMPHLTDLYRTASLLPPLFLPCCPHPMAKTTSKTCKKTLARDVGSQLADALSIDRNAGSDISSGA
jgi:hypothetical protein